MNGRLWGCTCAASLLLWMSPAYSQIIKPPLDDREYSALRSELISRIPAYAPEWTDHNTNDPGITMLELFAFVADDLGVQVELDLPDLLWPGYKPDSEDSLGPLAYIMIDAGYRLAFARDLQGDDWLMDLGIDPKWTYAELVAAAQQVPEPGTPGMIIVGLLALGWMPRRSSL